MFVSSTYRITGLHFIDGCATLSAAYVGYLYVENHQVTLQLLVRHLKQNLCWLPLTFRFTGFLFNLEVSSVKWIIACLLEESLYHTTFMGAPPKLQPRVQNQ